MKHSVEQWITATRPWSVPASAMPVLVTMSYLFAANYGHLNTVNWALALPCLLGAILFHFGGNLVSDYFDFKTGVDRDDNTGQRLLVDGVFEPKTILVYGLSLLAVGAVLGVVIVCFSSIYVLYVGLAGLVLTLLYSKLKYHALGDLDVFLIFGVLESIGTSYALLNTLDVNALLCAIPVGFLVIGILHSNNTRDSEFDKRANVTTLAMKMGLRASKIYYFALVLAAYGMIAVLVCLGIGGKSLLLCLFSLPVAIGNLKTMSACQQLNDIADLDGRSAKLVLFFSLFLIIGNLLMPYLQWIN